MSQAFVCAALRTPFGRYGGALSALRADDLAASPIKALMQRHASVDWATVDDVILGAANQSGEDNRNVARMAALLAGLPVSVGGSTVNRLCGSGMDAVGTAARAIRAGDGELYIAGGSESMSRAPFVMGKADAAFSRKAEIFDTTLGWRFVNPKLREMYGTDAMAETAENVASDFAVSRADQDLFGLRSQEKALRAQAEGLFDAEIVPVDVPGAKGAVVSVAKDEHPRATSLEALAKLKGVVRPDGTVTAGNASGINDGAAALLVASEEAAKKHGLTPMARIVAMATAGVEPRVMGIGPAPAVKKLLARTKVSLSDVSVIELNEAFAAQALAVTRDLGLADDDARVNPQGGAIALGHPLGASGARLVATAAHQLVRTKQRYAVCSMCIGVGQGIAVLLERV